MTDAPPPERSGDRTLMRSGDWMVGIFCDACGEPWAEKAPCPHCGVFSRPEARIFRQVVRGRPWRPWTWRKGYEFVFEAEGSGDGSRDSRDRGVEAG